MRWKSYKYYQNNPEVKAPFLAWTADRVTPILFMVSTIAAVALLVVFGTRSWASYERIIAEPVKDTPYVEMSANASTASTFARDLIKTAPQGVKGWKVNETHAPNHPYSIENCGYHELPSAAVLSTHAASGSDVSVRIQTYAAGHARGNFNRYRDLDCLEGAENMETENGVAIVGDEVSMITMGDVIIGITTENNDTLTAVTEEYASKLSEGLIASQCLELNVDANDYTRNPYVNSDTYKGRTETTTVETGVVIDEIPVPSSEVNTSSLNTPNLTVPESPLPNNFPAMPVEKVEKPAVPQRPETQDTFTGNAQYEVADREGPGCGWEWSGARSPVFNDSLLVSSMDEQLSKVQDEVDSHARGYVQTQQEWVDKMVSVLPHVESWNTYATTVNNVHDSWSWLESEREALRPAWNTYLANYEEWNTFYDRQDAAAADYDEQLKQCRDAQAEYDDWVEEWGDILEQQLSRQDEDDNENEEPSPSPSASNNEDDVMDIEVPEAPAGCETMPERPAILDAERGAEPQVPSIPEGVTIPESWENPKGVYGDVSADFNTGSN